MKYEHDAVVLIGRRDAGKDTVFNELNRILPNAYNVKFASLSKELTAAAISQPLYVLENKEKRVQPVIFNGIPLPLTPLQIVNALYFGGQEVPEIIDAAVFYAFARIPLDRLPVFTDIRRFKEIDNICTRYEKPLFIFLDASNCADYLPEDSLAQTLHGCSGINKHKLYSFDKNQPANSIARDICVKFLKYEEKDRKTLVLYADANFCPSNVIKYEPMQIFVDEVARFGMRLNLTAIEQMSVFQHVINLYSCDEIKLQPLYKGTNHMIYFRKEHEALLPRLKQMADRVLYIGFEPNEHP